MNTERHKKLREHRLALGKCGDCLNEALPGKKLCQYHLTRRLENSKKYHEKRRALNLCTQCGNPTTNRLCEICMEAATHRAKQWSVKRKEAGICRYCSNPATKNYSSKCVEHVAIYKQKSKEWHLSLKKQVIEGYGGKCQCPGGCSETTWQFLSVDHVNNDGTDHRKEKGSKAVGSGLYIPTYYC